MLLLVTYWTIPVNPVSSISINFKSLSRVANFFGKDINFFTLLGKLVGMGGWLLGLVLLLPMVIGWIIPGPLQKVKKKK